MAKITRTRLARGTKLTPDHIHGGLASAAAQMNAGTVDIEQLEARSGSFRINLHVPYLASDYPFSEGASAVLGSGGFAYCIPFTLPPTQDMFSADQSDGFMVSEDQPAIVLEEVSFSFDQRAEGAAIVDHRLSSGEVDPDRGKMDFEELRAYDLDLSLLEKDQTYFGNDQVRFDKVIFSAPVSNLLVAGNVTRFNPFSVTDINASLSPFKTYAFSISAPLLGRDSTASPAKTRSHALVSVSISLKVRSTLQKRDAHSAPASPIQNLPTKDTDLSIRTPTSIAQTVGILSPVAGDPISADDGNLGVSVNMERIDTEFRHKLKGGIDSDCETSARQMLANDAGYEVIAIPLMNNRAMGGIVSSMATEEPYTNINNQLWDRTVIPIHYPMVIHHVVLAWNWNRFVTTDSNPPHAPAAPALFVPGVASGAAADFRVHVGLAMGRGLRGDEQDYQQIAELEIFEPYLATSGLPSLANWDNNLIDRLSCNTNQFDLAGGPGSSSRYGNGAWRPVAGAAQPLYWEWELHQVPIINNGAGGSFSGQGYHLNGRPFFVGKSWSATGTRNNISPGIAPATEGNEQFLEARMKISYGAVFPATNEVVTGYQGHWLYVIGKKFLTR